MTLVVRDARVLTMGAAPGPRRGAGAGDTAPIARADVVVEGGAIAEITDRAPSGADTEIDARGRVLMPAFVDAHTHACWAGDRLDEWDRKRAGATYLEILGAGGGIMSTVRAVRAATERELADGLLARLDAMLHEGAGAVEVKSGYGLSTEAELKMLRAIRDAAGRWPGSVTPTACIGHAIDPDEDRGAFVERTIGETLDAVHAEFPGIAVDAYCEEGAWTLDEAARLFERAASLGHPIRVHADQFNALGMTDWAIEHGALSVDHLEATAPDALARLASSGVFGVMLPCSGFHLDGRYADGRAFIDGGGALVLATNCNPGSAPTSSVPMAIALAVRHLGVTPAEAIVGATANGAALLGLTDRGAVAPGRRADLVLLRHRDERSLAYEFGGDPVDAVILGGRVVRPDRARVTPRRG